MRYKITKKQKMSKMCFACGVENKFGLNARYYELENNDLVAIFEPRDEHQSYPNRLHGGLAATILDETMGRAIMVLEPDAYWGVTGEMSFRFLKPVPLDRPIKTRCRVTDNNRRMFKSEGEIVLENGEVAVTGKGVYVKMSIEQIAGRQATEVDMFNVTDENEPNDIEI